MTYDKGGINDAPAENDSKGQCIHCGRDNSHYPGEACSDDCPLYWEERGFNHPDGKEVTKS